jgi:hypothetical protein
LWLPIFGEIIVIGSFWGQLSGKAGELNSELRIFCPGAPFKDDTPDEDDPEETEGEGEE